MNLAVYKLVVFEYKKFESDQFELLSIIKALAQSYLNLSIDATLTKKERDKYKYLYEETLAKLEEQKLITRSVIVKRIHAEAILDSLTTHIINIPKITSANNYSPIRYRSIPKNNLAANDVIVLLKNKNLYDGRWNTETPDINNKYELNKVVYDFTTGLTWQQSGSNNLLNYYDSQKYVNLLNLQFFAGHNDWRIPTLEEALTLIERNININGLYIDAIFDKTQIEIWTLDMTNENVSWAVSFKNGYCFNFGTTNYLYARAVR